MTEPPTPSPAPSAPAPSPSPPEEPRARPEKRARIAPLPAVIGAIVGAFGAIVGSGVVSIAVAIAVYADEGLGVEDMRSPAFLEELMTNFPVVASSVVATGVFLVGIPMLTAKLSRTSIKEGLGLRAAPWPTFLVAPLGILALGPTSDRLVTWMKEIAPHSTMNALEMIGKLVEAHPWWMLWPIIALTPGIAEEVFFRGLIQRSAGFGKKAIVISALSFSFFHMDPHHIAGVLPLGFYLAWLGARTGSTLVPIVAHVVNNSMALLAGKLAGPELEDVAMPLWALPVGWLICAGCVYVVWRTTKDRARWLGPAAEERAAPDAPAVSPHWRIVRTVGAHEEVLGYVRDAQLALPDVIGRFQPGPAFHDFAETLATIEQTPAESEAHQEALARLEGFQLEDMASGERLPKAAFRIQLRQERVVFRALK
ncbi:MAG TPA: CPBP family intramembrane glutamic endopeptidase [Polyangiaceae bacterium LLY-WYZ-15_(1-7)]|nr:hypothetical protein [Sandaracinus sp.]HJL02987.1 CPBP family intramembrane glutamic endopeptidase [Polyangiaceae bacterium LLY-WYZ-15_(1-7)]MBJ72707.1 hypothetical protein [Sandaracinus sp.]HJL13625.1 CPBP family intramembrane glutamic endopeptidase [Polyangiaceae bacterium LLY-WYZ-15_(1-7)]HJL32433.1 CPBP family intramembrane glutamic endopeptidase [Polyangiaceae bacterium LLY-WYZ-15_(1-7)]